MTPRPCMGGWCARRDTCSHYTAESGRTPSERLCIPGQDGVIDGVPVVVRRQAGTWERQGIGLLRPAQPFDALEPLQSTGNHWTERPAQVAA